MCRIEYADNEGGLWMEDLHEVTCRKDRKCADCGRTITRGERYTYGVWLMPREGFMPVGMCAQCVAAGRWLGKVCGGHLWPGVMEELEEHWEEEPGLRSLGLGRLVLAGRKKWSIGDELVPVETVRSWVADALAHLPELARH